MNLAESGGKQSPLGLKAARMAAIKISEGFNLGHCRALPGKGPIAQPLHAADRIRWRVTAAIEQGRAPPVMTAIRSSRNV